LATSHHLPAAESAATNGGEHAAMVPSGNRPRGAAQPVEEWKGTSPGKIALLIGTGLQRNRRAERTRERMAHRNSSGQKRQNHLAAGQRSWPLPVTPTEQRPQGGGPASASQGRAGPGSRRGIGQEKPRKRFPPPMTAAVFGTVFRPCWHSGYRPSCR